MYRSLQTAATLFIALTSFMLVLSACSGCHPPNGGTMTEPERPVCPPCPPCPNDGPPRDPLAGSKINDGFTTEQRATFIRENVRSTVSIVVVNHFPDIGLGFGGGTGVAIRPNLVLTAAHVVKQYRYYYCFERILARDNLTVLFGRAMGMRIVTKTSNMRDVALIELLDGERIDRPIKMALGRAVKNNDLLWHFGRTTGWTRGKVIDADNPRQVAVDFRVAAGDSGGPVVWPDGTLAGTILSRSLEKTDIINDSASKVGYFITIDQALKGLAASSTIGE
ncbi:MAG: trypsin-like peptidase domain-containing protein [Patescibacteria group bacterium]